MPTLHLKAISIFFLKLFMLLSILIVVVPIVTLLTVFGVIYYFECETPPSRELVEGILGGPFEKTPIKVIDGFDACNWDSDVVVSATFTSRDGTSAFIDEIAKEYPLTGESDTSIGYHHHKGKEIIQISCNRKTNICELQYSICC